MTKKTSERQYVESRENIYKTIIKVFSSKKFFWAIVLLIILQGLWFAFTFQPRLFDEQYHFDFINSYTDNISPFLSSQPEELDSLGDTTRNPNYLYYFLMSWPLRAVKAITTSYFYQVLALRVISLAIFIGAVILYRKLLIRLGSSIPIANIAILLTILLPVFSTLTGTITYDTMVFFLFPVSLLLLLDIIRAKKLPVKKICLLLAIILAGSLIKVSFLPFMVAISILLTAHLLKGYGVGFWRVFIKKLRGYGFLTSFALIVLVTIPALLFLERPVQNVIKYKSPSVSCTEILEENRCVKNYTAARDVQVISTKKPDFLPYDPIEYLFSYWIVGNLRTQVRVLPTADIFLLFRITIYSLSLLGALFIIINLRKIMEQKEMRIVIWVSGVYVLLLFIEQYGGYLKLGQPAAISSRYLLPLVPLTIYLSIRSFKDVVGHRFGSHSTAVAITLLVLIFTQGGSITTHQLTVKEYRWESKYSLQLNSYLDKMMRGVVIERPWL